VRFGFARTPANRIEYGRRAGNARDAGDDADSCGRDHHGDSHTVSGTQQSAAVVVHRTVSRQRVDCCTDTQAGAG
jgi:hypothetical protein